MPPRPVRPRRARTPAGRSGRVGRRSRAAAAFRDAEHYRRTAEGQLRRFRGGSVLAVALTALLLLVGEGGPNGTAASAESLQPASAPIDEAAETLRALLRSFAAFVPRLLVSLLILAAASALRRILQSVLRRVLHGWHREAAASAVARLTVYSLAAIAVVSVLAGDVRALVGSVGLLGLAASWALQTPIESFTGWLLNAFRGYYRVGDRIAVGEVFGDVYRIDLLTTTIWEAGGPGKAVRGAQPTGALITVPNWEILRSNIVNYSRDFPYVWDELTFSVTNESDLAYASAVIERVARQELGADMRDAVDRYAALIETAGLAFEVDPVPRVYLSMADAWTNCTLRYLVPVRSRRAWATRLVLHISAALADPAHGSRIGPAYPRAEVRLRQEWQATDAD